MVELAQNSFDFLSSCDQFGSGSRIQLLELARVLIRHHHHVPGGVRKGVEHYKAMPSAVDNEAAFVISSGQESAKKTAGERFVTRDVRIAPRRKEEVHLSRKIHQRTA